MTCSTIADFGEFFVWIFLCVQQSVRQSKTSITCVYHTAPLDRNSII